MKWIFILAILLFALYLLARRAKTNKDQSCSPEEAPQDQPLDSEEPKSLIPDSRLEDMDQPKESPPVREKGEIEHISPVSFEDKLSNANKRAVHSDVTSGKPGQKHQTHGRS